MNPKKASKLIEEFSKENDLNKDLVEAVITSYWKNVRANMKDITYPRLYLNNFGTFVVSLNKLDKYINKYVSYLENTPPNSFSNFAKYDHTKKVLEKLVKTKEYYTEDYAKMVEYYKKRDELKKDLEQPGTDS